MKIKIPTTAKPVLKKETQMIESVKEKVESDKGKGQRNASDVKGEVATQLVNRPMAQMIEIDDSTPHAIEPHKPRKLEKNNPFRKKMDPVPSTMHEQKEREKVLTKNVGADGSNQPMDNRQKNVEKKSRKETIDKSGQGQKEKQTTN